MDQGEVSVPGKSGLEKDQALSVDPENIISSEQVARTIDQVIEEVKKIGDQNTPVSEQIAQRLLARTHQTIDNTIKVTALSVLRQIQGIENPTKEDLEREISEVVIREEDAIRMIDNAIDYVSGESNSDRCRQSLLDFLDMEIDLVKDDEKHSSQLKAVRDYYAKKLDVQDEVKPELKPVRTKYRKPNRSGKKWEDQDY